MPSHRHLTRPCLCSAAARRPPSAAPLQCRPTPSGLSTAGPMLSCYIHELPSPPWPDLPHLHHEGTRSSAGELDLGSVLLGRGIHTAELIATSRHTTKNSGRRGLVTRDYGSSMGGQVEDRQRGSAVQRILAIH